MKAGTSSSLHELRDLLQSLLDETSGIQVLKGKWLRIREKLTYLKTQLTVLSEFPTATSNSLVLDLLNVISHSLNYALLSATKCRSSDCLIQGKLKTQSEIDSILGLMDGQVKDVDVLIKSGILQYDAIAEFLSPKDATRAQARSLIARLHIGSNESKNSAMDAVLSSLQQDDKNVVNVVSHGIVPVLIRVLDCGVGSVDLREKCVAVIAIISMVESSRHALVEDGILVVSHLARILDSGSGFAKEKACVALEALSYSGENARIIGSRGGVASLLKICEVGTPGSQSVAAGVLRNLALFEEVRENLVEENGVSILITVAGSGTALAQENAIGCLSNLVKEDDNLKIKFVRESGIECLRNFWDSSSSSLRSLQVAAVMLSYLPCAQSISELLVSEGFIVRIAVVLNCGVLGLRIAAANAAFKMAFNTRTRREMGECGIVAPLIRMLDGKAMEEKEAAAKALSILVKHKENRRCFLKESEKGIVSVVQLLSPEMGDLNKKYLVDLLSSFLRHKKCTKQMVDAGASMYLNKLVDMEIEGAKGLLHSLGRARFWSMLGRR